MPPRVDYIGGQAAKVRRSYYSVLCGVTWRDLLNWLRAGTFLLTKHRLMEKLAVTMLTTQSVAPSGAVMAASMLNVLP